MFRGKAIDHGQDDDNVNPEVLLSQNKGLKLDEMMKHNSFDNDGALNLYTKVPHKMYK